MSARLAVMALLGLIASQQSCFGLCNLSPDIQSKRKPSPLELTANDSKGRAFEFYNKSYALLIGESNYALWSPLRSISNELTSLQAALEAHGFEVFGFIDAPADRLNQILECFANTKGSEAGTRVLVFYAGHGATRRVRDQAIGYVVPVDAPTKKPDTEEEFLTKAIRLSKFVEWASAMESKHVLFVFDSCFSGSILNSRGDPPEQKSKPSNYVFSDEANAPLREFIASGSEDQPVPEPSTFANLFVRALLGETEADSNHDGYLTGRELIAYLSGWVPKYVPSQTPVSGRIKDARLDRGDFIFKLPARVENVTFRSSSSSDALRPILTASAETSDQAVSARAYELESLITTAPSPCAGRCESSAPTYELNMMVPRAFPQNTRLEKLELRCISGACATTALIGSGPSISEDGRAGSASFRAWGASSTWRLSGTLGAKNEGDQVLVLNTVSQVIEKVAPGKLSIERKVQPPSADQQSQIEDLLKDLESDVTPVRRGARNRLAEVLAGATPETTATVVRRIPTGSYRYQLGVVEALSKVPGGWIAADTIVRDIVKPLAEKREPSLRQSAKRALDNMAGFIDYNQSKGGLTNDSSSRNPTVNQAGTKLRVTSTIALRALPEPEGNVVQTLVNGECVRVRGTNNTGGSSGWLRVLPSKCGS
ncbi:caspase family protein [Bradyrhizobium sp. 151]|uniref:caspase family protein n=1 Tax=Bradyrhizobium sp. 151 TaxID=2782626 RepID=UPI001FFA43BF|nr:caspase family protein [Bradyrhizobium sp. 151]MCK1658479.1 caspase family protein [Bradyrhizobium sp. 151]